MIQPRYICTAQRKEQKTFERTCHALLSDFLSLNNCCPPRYNSVEQFLHMARFDTILTHSCRKIRRKWQSSWKKENKNFIFPLERNFSNVVCSAKSRVKWVSVETNASPFMQNSEIVGYYRLSSAERSRLAELAGMQFAELVLNSPRRDKGGTSSAAAMASAVLSRAWFVSLFCSPGSTALIFFRSIKCAFVYHRLWKQRRNAFPDHPKMHRSKKNQIPENFLPNVWRKFQTKKNF